MSRLKLILLVGLGVGTGTVACSPASTPSGTNNTGGTTSTSNGGRSGDNTGGTTGSGGTTSSSGSGGSQSSGSGGSSTPSGTGGSTPSGTGGTTPSGTGGTATGSGGSSGTDARPDTTTTADTGGGGGGDTATGAKFSFFVTSQAALRTLSKNEKGFGGDLRYGEADGLAGADKICREIAEMAMPGAGAKPWKAFLSVVSGPGGMPVNAADRIGEGPWYDRLGRIVAMTKADMLQKRPKGADPKIINDLPNEMGLPNAHPVGNREVDNHHMLTGSKDGGLLYSTNKAATCQDWTSKVGTDGKPQCGVAWPRSAGDSWIAWGTEGGCAPGYNIVTGAGATEGGVAVGSNGGYGGFYCFSTVP